MIAAGTRPLHAKFILPALTEATSPYWRPIKYSLFPPLGLATIAAYLSPDDRAVIVDKPEALQAGYDRAYREFYRWRSINRASLHHGTSKHQAKHFFYASGWKKFEPVWDLLIQARQLNRVTPLLEGVLSKVTGRENGGMGRESRDGSTTPSTGPYSSSVQSLQTLP
ncbi:MAG: hypothetical protein ABSD75_23635 [Terriglobales bacterium]|jgi:hypothetical protein